MVSRIDGMGPERIGSAKINHLNHNRRKNHNCHHLTKYPLIISILIPHSICQRMLNIPDAEDPPKISGIVSGGIKTSTTLEPILFINFLSRGTKNSCSTLPGLGSVRTSREKERRQRGIERLSPQF